MHGSNVFHGVRDVFAPRYKELAFTRIVFVCGINTYGRDLEKWRKFVESSLVGVDFVPVKYFYIHTQQERLEYMIELTQNTLEATDQKTVVIGHSFGGLVAKAALSRMDDVSNVDLLVTLGSPHQMRDFGVGEAIDKNAIPASVQLPIITFGGRLDVIVPDAQSGVKDELLHETVTCTHVAFIKHRKTIKAVIRTIAMYFEMR